MDVIDLDEENNDDILEISDLQGIQTQPNEIDYERIVKESRVLWEFINKCLKMEHSRGMERVIKRSLIPIYDQASKEFRESHLFESLVTKAICNLAKFPQWKFSHIKELCVSLQNNIHKIRRKKLQKIVDDKVEKQKRKLVYSRNIPVKVRKKQNLTEIILSDDSEGFEVPIVDLDDDYDQSKQVKNPENSTARSLSGGEKDIMLPKEIPTESVQIDDENTDSMTIKAKDVNEQNDEILAVESEILKIIQGDHKTGNDEVMDLTARRKSNSEVIEIILDEKENNTGNVILITDDSKSEQPRLKADQRDNIIAVDISQKDHNDANNEVTEITEDEMNNEVTEITEDEINDEVTEITEDEINNEVTEIIEDETNNEIMEIIDDEKQNPTNNAVIADSKSKNSQVRADDNVITVCLSDEEVIVNDTVNNKMNAVDLLVPYKEQQYEGYDEIMIMDRIQKIEEEIKDYKTRVESLEQTEVETDTKFSPYILCENYKAKIVELHRQLCKLTGEKAVKRREVRLKAVDQRSPLPMKKLEDFINSNIGRNGHPHFPDFCDVVECVKEANIEGKLGWTSYAIKREARTLFTYCGRALQRSRQRREWRHLLGLVKSEVIEDPADSDPDLMRRLQANRRHANVREKELFDRYSEMDYLAPSMDDEAHFENCLEENRKEKSPLRYVCDKSNDRVRIAPISLQHKVTRIVQKSNHVEIVVSDTTRSSDRIRDIVENKTSRQSASNEEAIPLITGTFTLKNAVTRYESAVKEQKLLQPKEIESNTDKPSSAFSTNSDSAIDAQTNIKPEQAIIQSTNQNLHLQSSNHKHTSNIEEISKIESYKNSNFNKLLLKMLGCDNDKTPSTCELNKSQNDEISTSQNTNHSRENSPEYTKNSDEPGQSNEVSSTDNAIEQKPDLMIANNDVLTSQYAQGLDTMIDIKKEIDLNEEQVHNDDGIDANGSNELPDSANTDYSIDILSHCLKAKVVLPIMTIKFESDLNEDSNQKHNLTDSRNEDDLPKDELIQIKEEPSINIQKELDEFGDNFTMSIIDIEDPYLVVEISSDSSEGEDEPEEMRKESDL